jgi:hypothetical protein
MEQYYNKFKKDMPKYKITNLVILNCKNFQIRRIIKKYDYKRLEPFHINKVICLIAIKLKLLDS